MARQGGQTLPQELVVQRALSRRRRVGRFAFQQTTQHANNKWRRPLFAARVDHVAWLRLLLPARACSIITRTETKHSRVDNKQKINRKTQSKQNTLPLALKSFSSGVREPRSPFHMSRHTGLCARVEITARDLHKKTNRGPVVRVLEYRCLLSDSDSVRPLAVCCCWWWSLLQLCGLRHQDDDAAAGFNGNQNNQPTTNNTNQSLNNKTLVCRGNQQRNEQ